jgi:hypothetical protein
VLTQFLGSHGQVLQGQGGILRNLGLLAQIQGLLKLGEGTFIITFVQLDEPDIVQAKPLIADGRKFTEIFLDTIEPRRAPYCTPALTLGRTDRADQRQVFAGWSRTSCSLAHRCASASKPSPHRSGRTCSRDSPFSLPQLL